MLRSGNQKPRQEKTTFCLSLSLSVHLTSAGQLCSLRGWVSLFGDCAVGPLNHSIWRVARHIDCAAARARKGVEQRNKSALAKIGG